MDMTTHINAHIQTRDADALGVRWNDKTSRIVVIERNEGYTQTFRLGLSYEAAVGLMMSLHALIDPINEMTDEELGL